MMPLKTKRLRARHARRNPHLPHIMRLRRARIPLDQILQLAGEDLPVCIARDARRRVGGENEDYRACDVGGCVCGYPALVFGGVFEVLGFFCGGFCGCACGGGGAEFGFCGGDVAVFALFGLVAFEG